MPSRLAAPTRLPRTGDLRLATALLACLCVLSLVSHLRGIGADGGSGAPLAAHRVNVNVAPAGELCALPGVGSVLASRVVEARRLAPFRDAEDLRRVHGIGPVLAGRISGHARFDEPTVQVPP